MDLLAVMNGWVNTTPDWLVFPGMEPGSSDIDITMAPPATPLAPLPYCSFNWLAPLSSLPYLFLPLPLPLLLPLLLLLPYLLLVHHLRFRALHRLQRKYAAHLSNPYTLTYAQAREILHLALLRDDPFLFALGTQWALVKSYAIAKGTPLLVRTRQLADPSKTGRRAEDTAVFLAEMLVGDPDSLRGRRTVAKLNWLHGQYKNDIDPEDFVHTLSLFVLEPQAWLARYGWRPLTKLESVAHFLYWRELANRMGFGALVPSTLEDLVAWRAEYEAHHVRFAETNRIVTEATVAVFLRPWPTVLHGGLRALFAACVPEKRLREAIGFEDPPAWAVFLLHALLTGRAWFLRYLCLPRRRPVDPLARPVDSKHPEHPKRPATDTNKDRNKNSHNGSDSECKDECDDSPRHYRPAAAVAFEPWYVPDTWANRLALRWRGCPAPGPAYGADTGFLPEELGPPGFVAASREPVRRQAEQTMREAEKGLEGEGGGAGGCPFR